MLEHHTIFSYTSNMMNAWIYPLSVFIAMATWACLHSWLASFRTKQLLNEVIGDGLDRYYRLLYNLFAFLTLLPILAMVVLLPARLLWYIPMPWLGLSLLIQVLAVISLLYSLSLIEVKVFLGLRQLSQPDAETSGKLVTRRLYRIVRHPLYLFSMIILWLIPWMTDLVFAFVTASSIYFLIGTIPEERKMVIIFGKDYQDYQSRVPRIFPNIKF